MIDNDPIIRYYERRRKRLEARGIRTDFNDKHDKLGRFAPKQGGSAKTAEEMTKADIVVRGPKDSKAYIHSYLKSHPKDRAKIKKDAKKYANAMSMVKNFQKEHPNAEAGTYSASTGELVDVKSGYCVTFHQNYQIGNEYGGYDDETYAMMAAVTKHELGSEDVYIGYFGNPEISFNCKDYQKAKKFCIEHNQHSIFDAKTHKLWENEDNWDELFNPIRGMGSN